MLWTESLCEMTAEKSCIFGYKNITVIFSIVNEKDENETGEETWI